MTKTAPMVPSRTASVIILAVAAAALAISNQSFWIDEAAAASKALVPTLFGWAKEMRRQQGSDFQMPLYMLFLWAWQKIGGAGEWWLRFGNFPWWLLGIIPFCRQRIALAAVAATSSFAWYYLNEARPYTMQIAASMLLFAGARECFTGESPAGKKSPRLALAAGLVMLSGSSLLGMIWAGAALLIIVAAFPARSLAELRARPFLWTITTTLLAGLGGYYLWTLTQGVRASNFGGTDLRNVFYALYELGGFSGLGPGKMELRSEGGRSAMRFAWPLGIYALCALVVAVAGLRAAIAGTPKRTFWVIAIGLGAVTLFLVAVGYKSQFRILARHIAPLVVVWWIGAALGVTTLWRRGWMGRGVALLFLSLNLLSALEIRFATRHAKDDVRGAVTVANAATAEGKYVWWCADNLSADYYGLGRNARVSNVNHHSREALARLPEPQLIIVSRADNFDPYGHVATYLKENSFRIYSRLPSFTLWRKEP